MDTVLVVATDLRAPVVVVRRGNGIGVGSVVLAEDFAPGGELAVAGRESSVLALELPSPLLLAPKLTESRTFPVFPTTQWNRRAVKGARTVTMSFTLALTSDFPVNEQSVP